MSCLVLSCLVLSCLIRTSQGPDKAEGFHVTSNTPVTPGQLIVDTGASHVLFRLCDAAVLSHIQMSTPSAQPFTVLKAANGASLDSIGRKMLTIGSVTVIAYIFRDGDLVHNLLGIAPFADRGCTATFNARSFLLYHQSKPLILVGERHVHNLWRIPMPKRQNP
jgi:hypothetical protein